MCLFNFDDIQKYQFDERSPEDDLKLNKEGYLPFKDIELYLASGTGLETEDLNFIPFIYQERLNNAANMFIVFDIVQNKPTHIINISPTKLNLDSMYEDENGLNMFMLVRTSDIEETESE